MRVQLFTLSPHLLQKTGAGAAVRKAGHSLGGLVVQILLDRGLGAAGVAIDPAPAQGVMRLPLSMLRVEFSALRNPANA